MTDRYSQFIINSLVDIVVERASKNQIVHHVYDVCLSCLPADPFTSTILSLLNVQTVLINPDPHFLYYCMKNNTSVQLTAHYQDVLFLPFEVTLMCH